MLLFLLIATHEYLFCREKAFDLISRRAHASHELYLKLLKREFKKSDIASILSELKEMNLLDDRRFAQQRAIRRIRRNPCGRTYLIADLQSKGIDGNLAREVVFDVISDEDVIVALEKAIEKLSRRSSYPKDKKINNLLRKGFSWGDIKKHLDIET